MRSGIFTKTRNICILSFITAAVIFTAVIIGGKTYPFGVNCILRTDMYHQYAPFMAEFGERLRNGRPLGFTWNLGLGVNFSAIMAYYLASPLNLLIFFVGQDYTIEFMTVLIVLRVALAGAAFAAYLGAHMGDGDCTVTGCGAYIFSLFYALSGYMCAYYWNLMWLDAIVCFPLVVLGVERLIEGGPGFLSGILYGASLGYCIFTNYYISIFICIFLVIYFFAWTIIRTPEGAGDFCITALSFVFWSLIAAGLAAVMLIPEIHAFRHTISSETTFPTAFNDYFSLIRELSRHLPLVRTEQGLDHWPNIYCGTGMLLMFFLYVFNRRISLREKAVYMSMAFFLLASFAVNVLNFIWHGMHYPNSLPARQSFIYVFLMLVMGWRVVDNIRAVTRKDLALSLLLSVAFILMAQEAVRGDEAYGFFVFYIAIIFVSLYAGVLHIYRKNLLPPAVTFTLLMAVVVTELAANTAYTSITVTSRKSFVSDNEDVRLLVSAAYQDAGESSTADRISVSGSDSGGSGAAADTKGTGLYNVREDDADGTGTGTGSAAGFVRIERSSRKTKNDGAWLNFPSASIFSSMSNADCAELYRDLGCESSVNAYSITGSTPLVDMLLGVGYELTGLSNGDNEVNDLVAASGDLALYRNRYALSPGYMMPDGMQGEWELSLGNPAQVQNSLCSVLGTDQVLRPVYAESDAADGEFSVTISEDGMYYAFEGNNDAGDITVKWPESRKKYGNLDRQYFIELGQLERGELLTFAAEKEKDPEITIYKVDTGVLASIYERLSSQQLIISEYGDTYIRGTVTVDTDALGYISDRARMLITTPYDEGWSVKVDGEEVETVKGLGALLSFYLSSGTHEIELDYDPPGRTMGAVISLVSLGLLALAALIKLHPPGHVKDDGDADETVKDGGCAPGEEDPPAVISTGTENTPESDTADEKEGVENTPAADIDIVELLTKS